VLGPEPQVLRGRQALLDAQRLYAGPTETRRGSFTLSWYGSTLSDERGSFGVVDPFGPLADLVGDVVELTYYPLIGVRFGYRQVRVYLIGSAQNLGTDIGIARRGYMTLERLAIEPISVNLGVAG
jgi:hypothetical protein